MTDDELIEAIHKAIYANLNYHTEEQSGDDYITGLPQCAKAALAIAEPEIRRRVLEDLWSVTADEGNAAFCSRIFCYAKEWGIDMGKGNDAL